MRDPAMDAHAHDPHDHGHDAHGHGAGTATADHGPAEIPPVPAVRSITPAASDYELPWPGAGLLWPFVWLGVALVLYAAAGRTVRPIEHHGHEGGAEHAAPHGETPPHGE